MKILEGPTVSCTTQLHFSNSDIQARAMARTLNLVSRAPHIQGSLLSGKGADRLLCLPSSSSVDHSCRTGEELGKMKGGMNGWT